MTPETMAPAAPAGLDPAGEFIQGVQARNPQWVKEALDAGVSPDTEVNGKHPLVALLEIAYKDYKDPAALIAPMDEAEFARRTTAIVDTLLARGAKVTEENKYATPTQSYLADQFLLNNDLPDATSVIIQAIHETLQADKPAYKPDLPRYLAGVLAGVEPKNTEDFKATVDFVLEKIEQLHDSVKERLKHPATDVEKALALNPEKTTYWRQPFERADTMRLLKYIYEEELAPGLPAQPAGLSAAFAAEAAASYVGAAPLLMKLEKQSPQKILEEMKTDFAGLDRLKNEARSLVFRRSYDEARAKEGYSAAGTERNHSMVLIGSDGIGKSGFARKQAELLTALGIAGPVYAEVTNENLGRIVGSMTGEALAGVFAKADIITLELPGAPTNDSKQQDVAYWLLAALQMSLKEREKPPVVFLTGRQAEIEAALSAVPSLPGLFGGNFVPLPDPSQEQMGEALDRKLAREHLVIGADARAIVLKELEELRRRQGKDFGNLREIDAVVTRIPDAIAGRLFGTAEGQKELEASTDRKALLSTVRADDIKALQLKTVLGGPALARGPGMGFN